MASDMLLSYEGKIGGEGLNAVRSAEMIGLLPDAETRDTELRGQPLAGPADPRIDRMRALAETIEASLREAVARPSPAWTSVPSAFRAGRMLDRRAFTDVQLSEQILVLPEVDMTFGTVLDGAGTTPALDTFVRAA